MKKIFVLILMIMLFTNSVVFLLLVTKTYAQFGDCDSSYPYECIPSPPPDLDCKDISEKDFRVLPADPHKFDREEDGIGCET